MNSFWRGRKVFVTNPASVRGSWLCLSLHGLGAQVFGFGSGPKTNPSLFEIEGVAEKCSITFGDGKDLQAIKQALNFSEAEVLFHLGADASFKETREKPLEYLVDELVGTANVLDSLLETATVRAVVVCSSDKVYTERSKSSHSEGDLVGASEIYPSGKLCSEILTLSYRHQFFSPEKFNKHKVALAVARLVPALGGGDFLADSLVYQIISALHERRDLFLKNPQSVRPWISMEDQLLGLLKMAEVLVERGPKLEAVINLGQKASVSVESLAQEFSFAWNDKVTAKIKEVSPGAPSEHPLLDSSLAESVLGWRPERDLASTVAGIVSWYKQRIFQGP